MAKYRLPEDIKLASISLVKGYDRRKKEFNEKVRDNMESTAAGWEEYTDTICGKEVVCRYYEARRSGTSGRPTEARAIRLERLMNAQDTIWLRAVENAADEIGERYVSEEIRRALRDGIMLNCKSGRRWPYEALDLPTISRKDFYAERRRFLWRVAKNAKLV